VSQRQKRFVGWPLEENFITSMIKSDGRLLAFFERLEALARKLPRGSNPDLLHYLNRKSYEKARLLLEGRDPENARGTCH